METIKLILENQLLMFLFAAVVFLSVFGFLGVKVIPSHFSNSQVSRILGAASSSANIIGLIPILITLFFFFEDWFLWGLDKFDWKILLVVVSISLPAFIAVSLFNATKKELEKQTIYQQLELQHKVITGFALLVGVVALPGIKFFEKDSHRYDFYSEEDEEFEELESG